MMPEMIVFLENYILFLSNQTGSSLIKRPETSQSDFELPVSYLNIKEVENA